MTYVAISARLYPVALERNGTVLEDLGFTYHQVSDGNDIVSVCSALEAAKRVDGPVFIHALTTKGKGYAPAEENPGEYHGVGSFEIATGNPDVVTSDSFSSVFGKELAELGAENERICAITAAMKYGTGLQHFAKAFPDRREYRHSEGNSAAHAKASAMGCSTTYTKAVKCQSDIARDLATRTATLQVMFTVILSIVLLVF